MSLIEKIQRDARRFVSNGNNFAVPITFSNGTLSVTVNGTVKRHHTHYNDMGVAVSSSEASCTVHEKDLIAAGYIIRDGNGRVSMANNYASWQDSNGTLIRYKITQWFPDDLLGLIVCILSL